MELHIFFVIVFIILFVHLPAMWWVAIRDLLTKEESICIWQVLTSDTALVSAEEHWRDTNFCLNSQCFGGDHCR